MSELCFINSMLYDVGIVDFNRTGGIKI